MGIAEVATTKYGPLPAWGWAAVAGAGVFLYVRHKNAAGSSSTDSTAADQAAAGAGADSSGAGGGVDQGYQGSLGSGSTSDFSYLAQQLAAIQAQLGQSPNASQSNTTTALNTQQQWAAWSKLRQAARPNRDVVGPGGRIGQGPPADTMLGNIGYSHPTISQYAALRRSVAA